MNLQPSLPLVVFSHLRWDFVYQRPQHLLTRFAQDRPVFFIEEPVHTPSTGAVWERQCPHRNVTVLRPHTPCADVGFSDTQLPHLEPLIASLIRQEDLERCLLWMYTPMALPLTRLFDPEGVIFDCMDELSAFEFAPAQLVEREAQLLKQADIVFTGGPSLYRAKRSRHPHVHCFPSSVDAAHFGLAKNGLDEPADQADLPHPRLGFFGVIDERLDLTVLTHLAKAHPEWQIVMVGPVVKVDPAALPQAPNLHYLGQRPYEALPAYLTGWDVCLLPFARNRATAFISPTKTLEYMAAERPIVSTPITDVAALYGDIVYLGATPEAFMAGCEEALASSEAERARRAMKMRAVLVKTSWDETAAAMDRIIRDTLQAARTQRASAPFTQGSA